MNSFYKRKMINGNSVITMPLILGFSTIAIVTLSVFLINILKPFIMYEKLLSTSLKYMFIMEEYGYLNENDKQEIVKDLVNQGFNAENVEIVATDTKREYGETVELTITYWYDLQFSVFKKKSLIATQKEKMIPMRVVKYGISKI